MFNKFLFRKSRCLRGNVEEYSKTGLETDKTILQHMRFSKLRLQTHTLNMQ